PQPAGVALDQDSGFVTEEEHVFDDRVAGLARRRRRGNRLRRTRLSTPQDHEHRPGGRSADEDEDPPELREESRGGRELERLRLDHRVPGEITRRGIDDDGVRRTGLKLSRRDERHRAEVRTPHEAAVDRGRNEKRWSTAA